MYSTRQETRFQPYSADLSSHPVVVACALRSHARFLLDKIEENIATAHPDRIEGVAREAAVLYGDALGLSGPDQHDRELLAAVHRLEDIASSARRSPK